MSDAREPAICSSTGIAHISEIPVLFSFGRGEKWVACGGMGAVNGGLGNARGLSAKIVLRCTPCYCTCMPEKQCGL